MSKFAIRLLSLAMYATSLPVIPMTTPAQAETSSTKHIKKQHRKNFQRSPGFSDPRSADQAWTVTGPSSQAGPVCPGLSRGIDCRIFPPPIDEALIENGPARAGDAVRGGKLVMKLPQNHLWRNARVKTPN